jgi:hypothetical protein
MPERHIGTRSQPCARLINTIIKPCRVSLLREQSFKTQPMKLRQTWPCHWLSLRQLLRVAQVRCCSSIWPITSNSFPVHPCIAACRRTGERRASRAMARVLALARPACRAELRTVPPLAILDDGVLSDLNALIAVKGWRCRSPSSCCLVRHSRLIAGTVGEAA